MKLRWLLIGLCLILFSLLLPHNLIVRAEPNTATTYYVTGTNDPTPGTCTVRSGGGGYDCPSLRSAIIAANANSGWDTILLQHSTTYQLTIPITSTDRPETGDLDITQHVTFGFSDSCVAACNATIRGGVGWTNRLLEIDYGIRVDMQHIIFRNGYQPDYIGGAISNHGILTLTDSLVYSNTAQYGGGLYNGSGATLTLINTTVSSNTATTDYGGGLSNWGTAYINNTVFEKNASIRGGSGFYNSEGGSVIMAGGIITGNLTDTPSSNHGGGAFNAGWLSMTNTQIISNYSRWDGGGFANDQTGVAYLTAVTITRNSAGYCGGIVGYGSLTLDRVAVLSNTAKSEGGIHISMGILTMTNSQVGGNIGQMDVGGMNIDYDGNATIRDSWIFSNTTAGEGGGIRNHGTLMLTGSTLSGNQAGDGGGLYNETAANLLNSTLSGNRADHDGGGIFNNSPTYNLILNNVTLVNNQSDADANASGEGGGLRVVAGNVFVFNSLIAQNSDLGNFNRPDCSGTLTSVTYSLIQNTTGCTLPGSATGVITGKAAQIGPLMDHGGATWTHALLPNSPALNTGRPFGSGIVLNNCLSTDQRGVGRPMGLRCDIGAFEAVLVYLPVVMR